MPRRHRDDLDGDDLLELLDLDDSFYEPERFTLCELAGWWVAAALFGVIIGVLLEPYLG